MNENLFDLFQRWLQGEINAAVAGHASRIERLEERLQAQDTGLKTLQDAHLKLRDHVQAMLVPATMDADALLAKIRDAEDWEEALQDVLGTHAFAEAINEDVFDRTFDSKVKEAVQDLRFEVSVR